MGMGLPGSFAARDEGFCRREAGFLSLVLQNGEIGQKCGRGRASRLLDLRFRLPKLRCAEPGKGYQKNDLLHAWQDCCQFGGLWKSSSVSTRRPAERLFAKQRSCSMVTVHDSAAKRVAQAAGRGRPPPVGTRRSAASPP